MDDLGSSCATLLMASRPHSHLMFWKQFKSKSCTLRLKSKTKDDTLAEIVATLVESEALSPDLAPAALVALREREKIGSTGVGANVAIPHVKLRGLERATCNLCVHPDGVEWQAIDGA